MIEGISMHPNLSFSEQKAKLHSKRCFWILSSFYLSIKNTVSTFYVWFGINESHIGFALKYLSVNNSQSKHANMSVSVRLLSEVGLTLLDFHRAMHQIGYDIKTTHNRRGSWHLTEIGTLTIQPLSLHYFLRLRICLRLAAITQKF